MKLIYNDKILSEEIEPADTYYKRLKGLMFLKDFKNPKGLFFANCTSIHTFFMNFNLDLLYLDAAFNVVKVKKNIKPWLMTLPLLKAKHIIEFKTGFLDGEFTYDRRNFKCIDFFV